ncbi:MAG: tetratricopeptide repeat protein [Myxococcota bacterium]
MSLTLRSSFSVATLALVLLSGCKGSFVPKPPAPEDEVARLKREIIKVRFAVASTKELIDRSRGQPYLADLYLRLAELHVEEARYHYFIAYEGTKRRERSVTSVQARLLKNQAIGIYKRILDEFPNYQDKDKVLFFIAHEYRELGEYPDMLKYLERVIAEHEASIFRNEALLVVGDYYFDRSELKNSEKYYKRILTSPESTSHGMARYKLAWVRINEEDMKGALKLFEDTIEGLNKLEEQQSASASGPGAPSAGKKIDLRREALSDMVFPYTEVHKKPDVAQAINYFRRLADSRTAYLAAMSKLAKRWFVKGEYNLASQVYRELLALGAEDDDTLEWARRLYDGAAKGQQFQYVAKDVLILSQIGARRVYDWRIPEKERDHLFKEFEAYCRDLSTKAQTAASKNNDVKLYELAADAYENYLKFFSQAPAAQEIRQNLADSRFASKQYFLAGRAYEGVIEGVRQLVAAASAPPPSAPPSPSPAPAADKEKEKDTAAPAVRDKAQLEADKKEAIYTSVIAFNNALKESPKLSRLELVQARSGLRRSAREYIDSYVGETNQVAIKFNLAKSYYDEGLFDEATEYFSALVDEFPTSEEASISAQLALDALRVQDKFEEMAKVGKRFAANPQLAGTVRKELEEIVESAEGHALELATVDAGVGGNEAVDALLKFAERHKGTELGEKALVNAFATARNSDDLDRVKAIGQQIIANYPQSKLVPDIQATLGNMSAQAGDFKAASDYLEDAAKHSGSKENSVEMLKAAAVIKAHLGDVEGARQAYERVIQAAPPGQAKRDAAMQLAEILERAGDYKSASSALATASTEGSRSAAIEYRLGYALMISGRGGEAARSFSNAVDLGKNAADEGDREGAAGAMFYLSQNQVNEFEGVSPEGNPGQTIQKKYAALTNLETTMLAIIDLRSAKWVLAALARLGAAYQSAATFIERIPAPSGLDAANQEKFKAALTQRAADLKTKSQEAISTCAAKAVEVKVFTQAARACLRGEPLDGDPERRSAPPARGGSPNSGQVMELQKRIAKNSKDYEALAELAKLYLAVSDPNAAKLVLDKASEGGANAEIYNLKGVVNYLLGYPQDAYEEFDNALKQDATNTKARLNIAALYRVYGMDKLAEAEMVRVTSTAGVDPRDPALMPGVRLPAAAPGGGRR